MIHQGLETLTIAGVFVATRAPVSAEGGGDGDDAERTPAALIITGSPYSGGAGQPTRLPGLPRAGMCAPLLSPRTNVGQSSYIMGTLSIVDAGFECTGGEGCASRIAVAGNRNMYMRRATVVGFGTIARLELCGVLGFCKSFHLFFKCFLIQ